MPRSSCPSRTLQRSLVAGGDGCRVRGAAADVGCSIGRNDFGVGRALASSTNPPGSPGTSACSIRADKLAFRGRWPRCRSLRPRRVPRECFYSARPNRFTNPALHAPVRRQYRSSSRQLGRRVNTSAERVEENAEFEHVGAKKKPRGLCGGLKSTRERRRHRTASLQSCDSITLPNLGE